LDSIPFPSTPDSSTSPTTLVAQDVTGVDVNISANAAVKASVSSAIQRNLKIVSEKATRQSYNNIFTLISNEIVRKRAVGEDVGRDWDLDEAVKPNSGLRYIIVRGLVRANSATIELANTTKGDLTLTVPNGSGGEVKVDFSSTSTASCTGDQSPCFLSLYVMEPFINSAGNYDFRLVKSVKGSLLSVALRNAV
jgi:hypothetical protein